MSNFTKGIIMAIDFMITCSFDHPNGHVVLCAIGDQHAPSCL